MINSLYHFLEQAGYSHPLHPAATHIPIGCIIAAFLFLFISMITRRPDFHQTARHCVGLALVFLPIAAVLGYMDWQHNFSGAWLWPIKAKLALGTSLFVCLIIATKIRRQLNRPSAKMLLIYTIGLIIVMGIGYFGGELVYGTQEKEAKTSGISAAAHEGETLFQEKCSFCHYHDQTTVKIGPGLKGISQRDRLPTSGWPVSEENLRKQMVTPFESMPPFDTLSEKEMAALIAYLKEL